MGSNPSQDVVLITGCSTGIGRATAELLHQRGYRVIATSRNLMDIEQVSATDKYALDVRNASQVEEVVKEVLFHHRRIDVLINNAGYGQRGAVEDVPIDLVEESFDVNLYGPLRLIHAVLPVMRDHGRGRIVNLSSVVGRSSMPMMGVYCSTKFALEALSDSLRMEVQAFGIEVILIEPGPVRTDFSRNAAEASLTVLRSADSPYRLWYQKGDEFRIDRYSTSPEEVARTILRAISSPHPKARYPVPYSASLLVNLFPLLRAFGMEKILTKRLRKVLMAQETNDDSSS